MSRITHFGFVAVQAFLWFGLSQDGVTFGQANGASGKPAVVSPTGLADVLSQTLQDSVLIDRPDGADGAAWARGLTYKARFAGDGFTYIPYLGPTAPRNFPVRFTVSSITIGGVAMPLDVPSSPQVDGSRIIIDRGALREIYDLRTDSVEQSFELNPVAMAKCPAGAAELRLDVETDLAAQEATDGILLDAGLGKVRYGQAAIIDSRGRKVDLPTRLTAQGQIEITAPANLVADRSKPLIIDPLITTLGVEQGPAGTRAADVAYHLPCQCYAVCYEQFYSAGDTDVYCARFTQAGVEIPNSIDIIDFTGTAWANPRVANLRANDQFLVVAEVGAAPNRIIRGRLTYPLVNSNGVQFDISDNSLSGDKHNPDVGGDPYGIGGDPTYFMIVWERDYSTTDHDIHGDRVNSSGTVVGPTIFFENSGAFDSNPAISNSNNGWLWMVVWQRTVGSSHDIWGAITYGENNTNETPYPIDASGDDDTMPAVSSRTNPTYPGSTAPTPEFMVVYQENGTDLFARIMSSGGGQILGQGNLTILSGVPPGTKQTAPNVDTDSSGKFIVTYAERYGTNESDYDIYAQTFCHQGFSITAAEGRKNLAYSTSDERAPRVCSIYTSATASRSAMIAWQTGGQAGYGDISAATYLSPIACCPADIAPVGGNGIVDIDDLVRIITQWSGFCTTCDGDVNGDLAVDIDDLVAIITAWGGCQ